MSASMYGVIVTSANGLSPTWRLYSAVHLAMKFSEIVIGNTKRSIGENDFETVICKMYPFDFGFIFYDNSYGEEMCFVR